MLIVSCTCSTRSPHKLRVRWRCRAFTLVELLVVVAIIALLLGILLPALSKARQAALTTKDLSNLRNMEVAHQMYINQWNGAFIDVGLAHGASQEHEDEEVAWINTLRDLYGSDLLHRSPVDDSPHWPEDQGGDGVPITGNQYRRTSYGINDHLTSLGQYQRVTDVRSPSQTVHFVIMAFTGDFAGSDHIHAGTWFSFTTANIPRNASTQMQVDAHGGPARSFESISNYGFLDGHAETRPFKGVYHPDGPNAFDPAHAGSF